MQSLPVVILAAIAFITLPSLLPESYDSMRRSVAMIECRECYEIVANGKTAAVCNCIKNDSTLDLVKEKADSDTERKAMVCGVWINRLSFMPSCRGRIFTVNPFYNEKDMLATANSNIKEVLEKTIRQSEKMLNDDSKKRKEIEYYLNTHSVKDEGYNTMAAYNEESKKRKSSLEQGVAILKKLQGKKNLYIRKRNRYTLLYSEDGKKTSRVICQVLAEESRKHNSGTIMLQTDGYMIPKNCNSIYPFWVFNLIPEKGDSITTAAIFGLNKRSTANVALQKVNTFSGRTTSTDEHDIPQLLAPDGAPLFNRNGYYIGISNKGRIEK